MSAANGPMNRKLGTITIFLNKKSLLPPVYIASSISNWKLQEMSYNVDQEQDSGDFVFSSKFYDVPEGTHRYKFKLGLNSVHYSINDHADVDMDDIGNLTNVINVRYGTSTGLITHWGEGSIRVVDAEIASDSASKEEIEVMEQAASSVQQHGIYLEDRNQTGTPQDAHEQHDTGTVIPTSTISPRLQLAEPLIREPHVKADALVDCADSGSVTNHSAGETGQEPLPLNLERQGSETLPSRLTARSTTLYWDTITTPSGETLLAEDGGAPEIEKSLEGEVSEMNEELHARQSMISGESATDSPGGILASAMAIFDFIQVSASWLTIAVVLGAFAAAVAWFALAGPDVEPVQEL